MSNLSFHNPDAWVFGAIGEAGFGKLVGAFYKQVPGDGILGPMYVGKDLVEAEERLRNFLIFRFGGPDLYVSVRGHPRLRARHFPFHIDGAARDRWLMLMEKAMGEAELPVNVVEALRGYFVATANHMVNKGDEAL